MKKTRPVAITRRQALLAGLMPVGSLMLTGCSKELPPTYGHILRMGDTFTYAAHHALLPKQALVKEFSRSDISSFPAIGVTDPGDPRNRRPSQTYRALQRDGFREFRLSVEGLVAKPASFSLSELQRLPSRTQITKHMCEEGWTAIAEWTGVPLSCVLEAAGVQPAARFLTFLSLDGRAESIDMLDALHPQTVLAYGMNGTDIPVRHGAPLRARVERQLGYKSVKYVQQIVVSDVFPDNGTGIIKAGWSWYAGI
jgi:hypothetical protein